MSEHTSEWHIEAIWAAAYEYYHAGYPRPTALHDAIDAAMTHAFGDGYAQAVEDMLEKSARAMNETGQGEHLGVTK